MQERFDRQNAIAALKLFIFYFFGFWIIVLLSQLAYQYADTQLQSEVEREDYKFYILILQQILHFVYMLILIINFNKKHPILSESTFRVEIIPMLYAVLLGMALGFIFPVITNFGYFLNEDNFIRHISNEGILAVKRYFSEFNLNKLIINGILGTLFFPVLREILFRGILFPMYRRDSNVNLATIQVSIFFVIANQLFQFNQIDFISLFFMSVILCFIHFKSDSILFTSLVMISYDFPLYIMASQSNFYENPERYLVFNDTQFGIYFICLVAVFYSMRFFNRYKRPENEF